MTTLYAAVEARLKNAADAGHWPELARFAEEACRKQDRTWILPMLAGEALGGPAQANPAGSIAIACLQLHIIVVDDMLDDDPRGLYRRIGMPAAANLASALAAAAFTTLAGCQASESARLAAVSCLADVMSRTGFGQYLDSQNPDTESGYWAAVSAKSAPFFGAAFFIGAVLAGAAPGPAAQMKSFGERYGEIIQIFDDIHDTMARPSNADWSQGRSPLPILFAQTVPHPWQKEFVALRGMIAEPAALARAQDILIGCGAISYCIDQVVKRCAAARRLLGTIDIPNPGPLAGLLDDIIHPVNSLLGTAV